MTTICFHGKWHSSASFPRIFKKIAAFESRDQVESQRCAYYYVTLSAVLVRTKELQQNVDEFFTDKLSLYHLCFR